MKGRELEDLQIVMFSRDLDVMDVMEPVLTLGQLPQFGKKKKRKNLQIRKGIEGHTAPVLSLHKNPHNT